VEHFFNSGSDRDAQEVALASSAGGNLRFGGMPERESIQFLRRKSQANLQPICMRVRIDTSSVRPFSILGDFRRFGFLTRTV
jgi:hypothetical protein